MNYFDLHCDTAYRIHTENLDFNNNNLVINNRFSSVFEKWYQCFAVFIDEKTARPFDFYKSVVDDYKRKIVAVKPDNLTPILTVEGGTLIENDIDRLDTLKQDGVFSLCLTWNGENNLAGGAKTDAGLKPLGISVIKRLNELKTATDLSHLNKKSFYSAIEYAKYPMVSHTCFNEINPHRRNIDIEMLKLIAEKNGIVGICFYPDFLGDENVFEAFYKNVSLCLENGFENHIAIGSDFDGCNTPVSLSDVPKLYDFLIGKGLDEKAVQKLFFLNAKNYIESFDK